MMIIRYITLTINSQDGRMMAINSLFLIQPMMVVAANPEVIITAQVHCSSKLLSYELG